MADYLLAVALKHGHHPEEVRDYPVRDLKLLAMLDEYGGPF